MPVSDAGPNREPAAQARNVREVAAELIPLNHPDAISSNLEASVRSRFTDTPPVRRRRDLIEAGLN